MAWDNFSPPPGSFSSVWLSEDWNDQRLMEEMVEAGIDTFREHMPGLFPRLKKFEDGDTFERRWMWEEDYPSKLTGTLSGSGTTFTVTGNLFGKAVSLESLKNCIRVGAILYRDVGGVMSVAQVAAIDAVDPVLTLTADDNGTMPSDSSGQEWIIAAQPWQDKKPASDPRMVDRDFLYTTTQIFERSFGLEKSRAIQQMRLGIDEIEHQVTKLRQDMENELARACVLGMPKLDGSGDPVSMRGTAEPRMCGLIFWGKYLHGTGGRWVNAALYRDMDGEPVLEDDLNTMANAMYDNGTDFENRNIEIWADPKTRKYMHKYGLSFRDVPQDSTTAGFKVDQVQLEVSGKPVRVSADPYYPPGTLQFIDMDSPRYGYVKDDHYHKEEIPTGSYRSKKWQMGFQGEGVMLKKAKTSLATMRNIKQ
jgi:hypothetical protein